MGSAAGWRRFLPVVARLRRWRTWRRAQRSEAGNVSEDGNACPFPDIVGERRVHGGSIRAFITWLWWDVRYAGENTVELLPAAAGGPFTQVGSGIEHRHFFGHGEGNKLVHADAIVLRQGFRAAADGVGNGYRQSARVFLS